MKKHFYSHIVSGETFLIELKDLHLKKDEYLHLRAIIQSSLHYTILDVALTHLPEKDKSAFLSHVEKEDHNRAWSLLSSKVENIEEKIRDGAEALKKDFLKDIQNAKKKAAKSKK